MNADSKYEGLEVWYCFTESQMHCDKQHTLWRSLSFDINHEQKRINYHSQRAVLQLSHARPQENYEDMRRKITACGNTSSEFLEGWRDVQEQCLLDHTAASQRDFLSFTEFAAATIRDGMWGCDIAMNRTKKRVLEDSIRRYRYRGSGALDSHQVGLRNILSCKQPSCVARLEIKTQRCEENDYGITHYMGWLAQEGDEKIKPANQATVTVTRLEQISAYSRDCILWVGSHVCFRANVYRQLTLHI